VAHSEIMSGKTCVVTGANSGIGKETVLALARSGARVVLVCRNSQKGAAALEEIAKQAGSSQLALLIADMSSLGSVRALASQLQEMCPRLDVLINNAGAVVRRRTLSADGIELTLAGNYLGAALLTFLVLDLLKAGAPSRIINVSSQAQRNARLDMNDPQFERRKYSAFSAYGQSKLLMNAFTWEMAQRLEATGITANCLHPGVVATNIWGADPSLLFKIIVGALKPFMLDSKQGAEGVIYLATSPEVAQVSGRYFLKGKPVESNPLVRDPNVRRHIWQWTQTMTATHWEGSPREKTATS